MSKKKKYLLLFLLGGKIILISLFIFVINAENNASENVVKFIEVKNSLNISFIDKGIYTATWYGNEFHGQHTASGEVYNQNLMTAAHKSLPFGTLLKVTNNSNGKSVVVRINDRGPFVRGRELDLSQKAAEELRIKEMGIARLDVQQIVIQNNGNQVVKIF